MAEDDHRPNLLRYSTTGIEFIGIFGLMLTGGILLDRWLKTGAVFTFWCGLIGFGYALRRLLIQARKAREYRDRPGRRQDEQAHADSARRGED